jgi:hypothetical protein
VFEYNEPLSHLIYAGADVLLVPSMFEPCGLTQVRLGERYAVLCCAPGASCLMQQRAFAPTGLPTP